VPDTPSLNQHIYAIGQRMVACRLECDGIHLDASKGILPRSLVLERQDRKESRGSVALGINPGQGDEEEEAFYLGHGNTYEAMLEFWNARRRLNHPYHARTRRFIDAVGLDGPILWTELVKCQNPRGVKVIPPLPTLRRCVHLYLVQEIAAVPPAWPVVAIGKEPYKLAALMFPSRTVIGIPHPTGSYGLFPALFDSAGGLTQHAHRLVTDALASDMPAAVWLVDGTASKGAA